ncbi:hypothetical protein D3C85_1693570 [compost metagenome]
MVWEIRKSFPDSWLSIRSSISNMTGWTPFSGVVLRSVPARVSILCSSKPKRALV